MIAPQQRTAGADRLHDRRAALRDGERTSIPRASIRASWERCAARGLSSERLAVPWSDASARHSSVAAVAEPVLKTVSAAISGEPISVMMCDEEGNVVIRKCGDKDILRALDSVALAPGSNFSEEAVGTNGFGLALADDKISLVSADEHFNMELLGYTCVGAPIHEPATGRILGALSLTTWSQQRNDLLGALAGQIVANIEYELAQAAYSASSTGADGRRARLLWRRADDETDDRDPIRLREIEREAILAAFELNHGRIEEAADELGISRATMYRRLKVYGLLPRPGDEARELAAGGGNAESATPI